MSWKWRNGDHTYHSQNLPQNLGRCYINELIFELIAAAADRAGTSSLQFEQSCCQQTAILPPGRTDEVAPKKNSTLANLTSLDYSLELRPHYL